MCDSHREEAENIYFFHCIIWLKNCFWIELLSPISGARNIDISSFPITCRLFLFSLLSPFTRLPFLSFTLCVKNYIFCVSRKGRRETGMAERKNNTSYKCRYWNTQKEATSDCGTISKERISLKSSSFLFLPQQLEIINCRFHALPSENISEKQSEGKFNQVIKHFLLKHQLNLMVFLLPLLLNVGEALALVLVNKNSTKTKCNLSPSRFYSWRVFSVHWI